MNTSIRLLTAIFFLFLTNALWAYDIRVSNVRLGEQDEQDGFTHVDFDLEWQGSWRMNHPPGNWDAAWVFIKFRLQDQEEWHHASLHDMGHFPGTGTSALVQTGLQDPGSPFDMQSNPGLGVFLYRDQPGAGDFGLSGVSLRWNYIADGLANDDIVDVEVFAIEMVHIPDAAFYLGSGGEESGSFTCGSWSGGNTNPYLLTGEQALEIGHEEAKLWATSQAGDNSIGPEGILDAEFPKGYRGVYMMKYGVSQQQYVDFLNLLTPHQASARSIIVGDYRNAIFFDSDSGLYDTAHPYVACNFISWADGAAYLAWSGLRPMTELEYEKAARGGIEQVNPGEYAWGGTAFTPATGIINVGEQSELPIPNDANAALEALLEGPIRVGAFAATGGETRERAGGAYYGVMELSGNLWERVITVGNEQGRLFRDTYGEVMLDHDGFAIADTWPDNHTSLGTGLRGGAWDSASDRMRISDRHWAVRSDGERDKSFGLRGVRTPPSAFVVSTPVTDVEVYTAEGGGEVIDDGGSPVTERGLVWGTSINPTLFDNQGSLSLGSGLGSFHGQISGLEAATTYYIRAYAINAHGEAYGNQLSFHTEPGEPDAPVATEGTNPGCDGFTANWNSVEDATGYLLDVSSDIDFGSFELGYEGLDVGDETQYVLTGLEPGTYHYRLKAYNDNGNSDFSNVITISTLDGFAPGAIATTGETICYQTLASEIGSLTAASGGDGEISYQWQHSSNGTDNWTNVTGGTSASYTPPSNLTADTWYRRQAKDGTCNTDWDTSDGTWKVTVRDEFLAGAIATVAFTFTDSRDGQEYKAVYIGNQVWMAENLKWLPDDNDSDVVSGGSVGGDQVAHYYIHGFGGGSVGAAKEYVHNAHDQSFNMYETYGVLYNWPAVVQTGSNAICPEGWRVPGDEDWTNLVNFLFSEGYSNTNVTDGAGNALKSCRQDGHPYGGDCDTSEHPRWLASTHSGFDEFGFSALPAGSRHTSGSFLSLGTTGIWWSATEQSSTSVWTRRLLSSNGAVHRNAYDKSSGLSVRCIRDRTFEASGETICYQGNASEIVSLSDAGGGDGEISYRWQQSPNGETDWNIIESATSASYTPPADLTTDTWYRRQAKDATCNNWTTSDGTWKVTVRPQFLAGSIGRAGETICYQTSASEIGSVTLASGGDGNISYQWQHSSNGTDNWTNVTGGTGTNSASYTPPANLTADTWYRRQAKDGACNDWTTSEGTLSVGDSYGGGIVANVSPDFILIHPTSDQSTSTQWHSTLGNHGGTGTAIGDGYCNTYGCDEDPHTVTTARKICVDLELNGYTDWFLPSQYELRAIYQAWDGAGRPSSWGLVSDWYWSSNQQDSTFARSMEFIHGIFYNTRKTIARRLRCVRAIDLPSQPLTTWKVTVNSLPPLATAENGARCDAGEVEISVTNVPAGSTIDWYDVPTGGSVLSGGQGTASFNTPEISQTTTYYAETRDETTGCVSSSRVAVTATIFSSIPDAPAEGDHDQITDVQIRWQWESVVGANGYRWHATDDFDAATDVGADTHYLETGLSGLTTYTRYVWAYNTEDGINCESPALVVSATTLSGDCGSVTFEYNGEMVTYGTVSVTYNEGMADEYTICWLDRNLGAQRVATSFEDELAYGDMFQWGRGADGHQLRTSGTVHVQSSTDDPGHGDFISVDFNWDWPSNLNWRYTPNDRLWQGDGGINDPCPEGWRVPTSEEWVDEMNSWEGVQPGINDGVDYDIAFQSPLKLTAAGRRNISDGSIIDEQWASAMGYRGLYWSSDIEDFHDFDRARYLSFRGSESGNYFNFDIGSETMARGISVRCRLANEPDRPGDISGPDHVPSNSTHSYQIDPVADANNYTWEFAGSVIEGATGTSVSLEINHSGTLRVRATNQYGSGLWREMEILTNDCGVVTFEYMGETLTYGTIVGAEGLCWMDRDLGAHRVSRRMNDHKAHGDMFQWGRGDDGHQVLFPLSTTTTELSADDQPGHDDFILAPSSPFDWRSAPNDDLWQGDGGINDPCPEGWRVPTAENWDTESSSWPEANIQAAVSSPLRLTTKRYRSFANGYLGSQHNYGAYHSATLDDSGRPIWFQYSNTYAELAAFQERAWGGAVRCILSLSSLENISAPETTGGARCGEGVVSLSATQPGGANTNRWYSEATGGEPLHTGTTYLPNVSETTTFYVSSYHHPLGYESAERAPVTATIVNAPDMPVEGNHSSITINRINWRWSLPGATGFKWHTAEDFSAAIEKGTSTNHWELHLGPGTTYTRFVWAYHTGAGVTCPSPARTITATTLNPSTGDEVGGGIFVSGNLIAAKNDDPWGPMNWNSAVVVCENFATSDGMGGIANDWFLPSKEELQEVYNHRNHIGGFDSTELYWSSTNGTHFPNRRYALRWAWGNWLEDPTSYNNLVRCVRYLETSEK